MECKNPGCNNEVIQTGKGRPRLFCSPECTKAFWNQVQAEEKRTGARSDDHKMSDVDPETQMGSCSQCGPVKAYASRRVDGTQRWRCSKRVLAQESIGRYWRSDAGKLAKFRKRHGLTHEEADRVIALKGSGCAICGAEGKELVYDHDHVTGKFRGWLCHDCNLGLGKLGDTADRLKAAALYLGFEIVD
jgi:hypothetical protein